MKPKESCFLELDGKINILTRKGRVTEREELDGLVCLKAILYVLDSAINHYEATKRGDKKKKRLRSRTRKQKRP